MGSVANEAHKKRVAEALAKKVAERARATTAQAVGQAVEAAKPAATVQAAEAALTPKDFGPRFDPEFKVKPPKTGPKYGRMARHVPTKAERLFKASIRPEIKETRKAVQAAFKPKPVTVAVVAAEKVTEKVGRLAKAYRAALPVGGPAALAARPITRVAEKIVSKVPFVRGVAKPFTGFIAKKIVGPAGMAADIATTGYAGYRGYKAYKEHAGLAARAEKLKVPMKRRSFAGMAAEAVLGGEGAEMDPKIQVYDPKRKRWQ